MATIKNVSKKAVDGFVNITDQANVVELQAAIKSASGQTTESKQEKIQKQLNTLLGVDVGTHGQNNFQIDPERISRYNAYNKFVNEHRLLQKAISAYTDNIFLRHHGVAGKDEFDMLFNVFEKNEGSEEVSLRIKELFNKTSLIDMLKNEIVPKMLVNGNHFVELVDTEDIGSVVSTKQTGNLYEDEMIRIDTRTPVNLIEEDTIDELLVNGKEGSGKPTIEDIGSLDTINLQNIRLESVNAERVVIVRARGILYGYIVFEEDDHALNMESKNIVEYLNKTSDKLMAMIKNDVIGYDKFVDDNKEMTTMINNMLYDYLIRGQKISARFVSRARLFNFSTKVDKYLPYGTSVVDNAVSPANMEGLSKTSTLIAKIARTPVLRNWVLEVGERKDEAMLVKRFHQSLEAKNVTSNNIGSLTNASRTLTGFEDVVTISKNGKRFVDLEHIETPRNAEKGTTDRDLREETIEALDVPASYLGIASSEQLRETIVSQNVVFASKVDYFQANIEVACHSIISTIVSKMMGKDVDIQEFVVLSMNHPIILKLQAYEQLLSTVSNTYSILSQNQIMIDPYVFFKKELPYVDWDTLKHESVIETTRLSIINGPNPEMGEPFNLDKILQETEVFEQLVSEYKRLSVFTTEFDTIILTLIQHFKSIDPETMLQYITQFKEVSNDTNA